MIIFLHNISEFYRIFRIYENLFITITSENIYIVIVMQMSLLFYIIFHRILIESV